MAHEITLQELQQWIDKNQHRTWKHNSNVPTDRRTLEVKYLRFSLDTRDMKIFNIVTDGFGDCSADFRDDDKDWTLLDLLDSKLKKVE